MKGFKRCEKGHMYKENVADCPYCPKGSTKSNDKTEVAGDAKLDKTEIFVDSSPKTEEVKQNMLGMGLGKTRKEITQKKIGIYNKK